MSQEPKVTRFGADPTVDQELATKAYVDAGGGGGTGRSLIGGVTASLNAQNTFFFPLYVDLAGTMNGTVEANEQIEIFFAFTIQRLTATSDQNTKTSDFPVAFRDDGVSVATLTILAGTTGQFDSGVLAVDVVSGSLCNWLIDTSANTGGIRMSVIAGIESS